LAAIVALPERETVRRGGAGVEPGFLCTARKLRPRSPVPASNKSASAISATTSPARRVAWRTGGAAGAILEGIAGVDARGGETRHEAEHHAGEERSAKVVRARKVERIRRRAAASLRARRRAGIHASAAEQHAAAAASAARRGFPRSAA